MSETPEPAESLREALGSSDPLTRHEAFFKLAGVPPPDPERLVVLLRQRPMSRVTAALLLQKLDAADNRTVAVEGGCWTLDSQNLPQFLPGVTPEPAPEPAPRGEVTFSVALLQQLLAAEEREAAEESHA